MPLFLELFHHEQNNLSFRLLFLCTGFLITKNTLARTVTSKTYMSLKSLRLPHESCPLMNLYLPPNAPIPAS